MDHKMYKVLLLDDDPALREVLSDVLKMKGYEPIPVATGAAALAQVEQQDIDVVLIDIKLEELSSLEVLRGVKTCSPDTECILLTGQASLTTAIEAINLGAFSYLQKPFEMEQLLVTIRRAAEKRAAGQELSESEERLRMVIENISDGIYILDLATGKYIFMSPSQVALTGFSEEEMENITAEEALERVHPEDREISKVQQQWMAAGEEVDEPVEYRWKVKSGDYHWFSDRRSVVRNAQGCPVALVGVSRDITNRKRAEKALLDSEDRYRAIYEGASIGIAFGNLAGNFVDINPALYHILGYSLEELSCKTMADITHPDDLARDFALFQETVEGRRQGYQIEKRFYHKDGNIVWGNVHITVVRDQNENPEYAIGMIEDITERKRA